MGLNAYLRERSMTLNLWASSQRVYITPSWIAAHAFGCPKETHKKTPSAALPSLYVCLPYRPHFPLETWKKYIGVSSKGQWVGKRSLQSSRRKTTPFVGGGKRWMPRKTPRVDSAVKGAFIVKNHHMVGDSRATSLPMSGTWYVLTGKQKHENGVSCERSDMVVKCPYGYSYVWEYRRLDESEMLVYACEYSYREGEEMSVYYVRYRETNENKAVTWCPYVRRFIRTSLYVSETKRESSLYRGRSWKRLISCSQVQLYCDWKKYYEAFASAGFVRPQP